VTQKEAAGFDTVTNTKTDQPEAASNRGRSPVLTIVLFIHSSVDSEVNGTNVCELAFALQPSILFNFQLI